MKAAFSSILGAAALACVASAASAASFPVSNLSSPQQLESTVDGSVNYQITGTAAGGSYLTSFTINGYNTLDGANGYYEDDFYLKVNGTTVFDGTFNLGGGGSSLWSTTSATVTPSNPDAAYGSWAKSGQGGTVTVTNLPITLLNGSNTLEFEYVSPTTGGLYGGGFAGDQGIGDESWGISGVSVTGVPEPAAWSLMLLGVGGIGATLRNRRRKALAV